jgi:hypothetical protein
VIFPSATVSPSCGMRMFISSSHCLIRHGWAYPRLSFVALVRPKRRGCPAQGRA